MPGSFRSAVPLLLLLLAASLSRAERIVSSLTNANITQVSTALPFWLASPFTTDPNYRFLTSVTVGVGLVNATVNVRLFSDNGGQPGSTIADLGTQVVTQQNSSLLTFTASSQVLLNASTTYWVGLGSVSTNAFTFSVILDASGFAFAAVPGASMTNFVATGSGSGPNPPAQFDSFGTNAVLPFELDGELTKLAVLTLQPQPGGSMKIISTNGLGYPHLIQAATNLAPSVVWEDLGSNTLAPGGAWEFTDLTATNHQRRFYRSRVP